jgi:VWFA-related protein
MNRTAIALLLLSAPLLAQKNNAPAQIPEMPPVPVDVVVTDQSNVPIHGLTASDFHLFQDGKEQAIVSLQPLAGTPGPEPKPIAFLFGPQSPENRKWIQQATSKFVAASAGPAHPVVIVFTDACYNTSVTPLSSDPDQVQGMLQAWPEQQPCDHPADFGGFAAAAYYAQVAESLAQVPGHKTAILFVPAGGTAAASAEQKPAEAPDSGRTRNRKEPAAEPQHDPFDMKHEYRKADASVYPVQVQAGAAVPAWALDLADATGGHALTRDQDGPDLLDRLARERAEAYTLVFKPRISAEGSCHELKVAVNRTDVKIFGRNLYCNIPEVTATATPPKKNEVETLAASGAEGNTDASVSIPFFYEPDGMARVDVALDIPSPRLEAIDRNGEVHAELDLLGMAYVPGGAVAAQFTHKCSFDFDTRHQFDEFLKRPLHCEHQFKVAPGNYQFKLVFRSSKDRFGTAELPLAIDSPRPAQLSLSAIALSRDVHPISPEGAQDEAESDEAPLIFRGNRISISGSDLLLKTGAAEAYFEVYRPPVTGAAAGRLTLHLRLLDEGTNRERWNSGEIDLSTLGKPGDRVIPIALRLPVASLPAGKYRAELTVNDATGGGATRSISFRTE